MKRPLSAIRRAGSREHKLSLNQPVLFLGKQSFFCGVAAATKNFKENFLGEMAELAEGARLLSECGAKVPPRVRIPLSPPSNERQFWQPVGIVVFVRCRKMLCL